MSEVTEIQSHSSIYSIAPHNILRSHVYIRHKEDAALFYYGNYSQCDSSVSFHSPELN